MTTAIDLYRQANPLQTLRLASGKAFSYRLFRNEASSETLVLLTGGIGLSDLFYLHFERFSRSFSVMTFDYQEDFATLAGLADAAAEALRHEGVRGWLVGQSLGGIVAEALAVRHPDVVTGLVLSNTCAITRDMAPEARAYLERMLASQQRFGTLLKVLPFGLIKRLMARTVRAKLKGHLSEREQGLMDTLTDEMQRSLTRPYELHMARLLCDAPNLGELVPEQFARWDGRVLLILSEDDDTFSPACKQALIELMGNPRVVTDLTGGHLALLVRLEEYATTVEGFVRECCTSRAGEA